MKNKTLIIVILCLICFTTGLFIEKKGLPIAFLEAMSYGLSCIASDISANREISLAKVRFFKAGDVGALAEKIKEFIGKPFSEEEKKKQIGLIADKYDWEKIADRTLEVYRTI